MCFSAGASFAASGALAVAAGANAKTKPDQSLRLLAAIPLLFSVQQFIEGVQWVIPKGTTLSLVLGYAFLAFAFVLWPAYMPIAMISAEPNPRRKRFMRLFAVLGVIIALYLLGVLLVFPLEVVVDHHHIDYAVRMPYEWVIGVLYVVAVSVAPMCSTRPILRLLGLVTWIGAVLSAWFTFETFTSVWCFLYAVLSVLIYLELRSRQKKK